MATDNVESVDNFAVMVINCPPILMDDFLKGESLIIKGVYTVVVLTEWYVVLTHKYNHIDFRIVADVWRQKYSLPICYHDKEQDVAKYPWKLFSLTEELTIGGRLIS